MIFYDNNTKQMLADRLDDFEKNYIANNNLDMDTFLISRYNMILSSLTHNYISEYNNLLTIEEKNAWFFKYLNLESHDMMEMPDTLL